MKLKFEIEVDLTTTILESGSYPFIDFSEEDWENYIKTELREKLNEVEMNCGAEISISLNGSIIY